MPGTVLGPGETQEYQNSGQQAQGKVVNPRYEKYTASVCEYLDSKFFMTLTLHWACAARGNSLLGPSQRAVLPGSHEMNAPSTTCCHPSSGSFSRQRRPHATPPRSHSHPLQTSCSCQPPPTPHSQALQAFCSRGAGLQAVCILGKAPKSLSGTHMTL